MDRYIPKKTMYHVIDTEKGMKVVLSIDTELSPKEVFKSGEKGWYDHVAVFDSRADAFDYVISQNFPKSG